MFEIWKLKPEFEFSLSFWFGNKTEIIKEKWKTRMGWFLPWLGPATVFLGPSGPRALTTTGGCCSASRTGNVCWWLCQVGPLGQLVLLPPTNRDFLSASTAGRIFLAGRSPHLGLYRRTIKIVGPLDPLRHSLRSRSPCSPGRVPSNSQAPPSRPFFLPLLNRAQTIFPSALGSRCPCSSSVAAGRSSLHGRAPPQKPLAHPPVHAVHPEDLRRSARHRSVSSDWFGELRWDAVEASVISYWGISSSGP